ncbi:MAG: TolC family protein [Bacteroidetes bacterium]|nr:TolC family protein [Bacteroidota bacterium]
MRKLVPSVVCLLMLKGTMDAQTPAAEQLTILQALREAVLHNPSLHALSFEGAAADADIVTAGLRPNPSLSINGDLLPSDGYGPKQKQYGGSLILPFELGGKRDARLGAASAAKSVTERRYEDAVRQTQFAVKNAYIDLTAAYVKTGVMRESLVLLDSLVVLDSARVRGQDIPAVDLTRSEVERERFSLDVLANETSYRTTSTALLGLLGRRGTEASVLVQPDTTAISRVASLIERPLPSIDSIVSIAAESRSDIRVLLAAEQAAQAQIAVAKSLASIDLSVSLDAMRQQEVTFWGASISFPLPIFDRHQGDIQRAEAMSAEAKAQTEAALLQLRADIRGAMLDVEAKRESLRRLGTSILEKSKLVRSSVEYAYRRGSTSLVDFLDVARTENELRELYVDALAAYAKSLINLDYVTGKDLFYVIQ